MSCCACGPPRLVALNRAVPLAMAAGPESRPLAEVERLERGTAAWAGLPSTCPAVKADLLDRLRPAANEAAGALPAGPWELTANEAERGPSLGRPGSRAVAHGRGPARAAERRYEPARDRPARGLTGRREVPAAHRSGRPCLWPRAFLARRQAAE